jgi:hypothetical protein
MLDPRKRVRGRVDQDGGVLKHREVAVSRSETPTGEQETARDGGRQLIGIDTSPGVSGEKSLSGPRIDVPFPVPSSLALAYSTVFNSFSTNPGDSAFTGILLFIFVNTTLHTQTRLSTIFLVRRLSDSRSRGSMER